eukprot:sb/3463116/
MLEITPKFHGKVEKDGEEYVKLQDLLAEFDNPSVCDIKMGTRTYLEEELAKAREKLVMRKDMYEKMVKVDDKEPTEEEHQLRAVSKPRYMQWREKLSSTATLGFRIDGIKQADRDPDKNFKTVRSEQEVAYVLRKHIDYKEETRLKLLERLKEIRGTLEKSHFFKRHEVIGSSLLLVHDQPTEGLAKANVWMIDFGKTTPLLESETVNHRNSWSCPNMVFCTSRDAHIWCCVCHVMPIYGVSLTLCPYMVLTPSFPSGNREDGFLFGLDNLVNLFENLDTIPPPDGQTYLEEELAKAREKLVMRKDMYEKMVKVDDKEPTEEEHQLRAVSKPRYMQWREKLSSTATLGFRIDGIKQADRDPDKNFKTVRSEQEVAYVLRKHIDYKEETRLKLLERLKEIRGTLEKSHFFKRHEVIGSSLLLVHDQPTEGLAKANVWMIDFGKTTPLLESETVNHRNSWVEGNREDGFLFGLDNLVNLFENLDTIPPPDGLQDSQQSMRVHLYLEREERYFLSERVRESLSKREREEIERKHPPIYRMIMSCERNKDHKNRTEQAYTHCADAHIWCCVTRDAHIWCCVIVSLCVCVCVRLELPIYGVSRDAHIWCCLAHVR